MTTTGQDLGRPVTGRPTGGVIAALVVVLGFGGVSAALLFTSPDAVVWVMLGGFAVLAVIGVVLMAVRDTFWMGVGLLAGAAVVAAADLVALLALADAFR